MKANVIYETKVITKSITEYKPMIKENIVSISVNNNFIEYNINEDNGDKIIVFSNQLDVGDILQIEYETLKNKMFTRRSFTKNEVLSLYTNDQKLKNNTSYCNVVVVNDEQFEYRFKSMYSPYYTKIKTVRDDVGGMFDNIDDDIIAKFIFDNSLLANDIITQERLEDVIGDGTNIPLYVSNYVRYKTDIDLANAIYMQISGKLGAFDKTLGSLSVSNEYKLPDVEAMLKRFKELLKPNEEALNPGVDTPLSFRKAGGNEYTVIQRGVF